LPAISFWCAMISSSEPYWFSHFAAVFGPTFGTPGMLSELSEVADDLLRIDVELGLDAVAVERGAGHRVDQRDSRPDQLRHVLVAGRNQDIHAGLGCAPGQRADHVVGFDALDAQHWQAERLDGLDQGLHL